MKPKLKIIKSVDKQYQYQVFRKEALVTSETYTRKASAVRGFDEDLLDAVLLISWSRNNLIDALERTGLLSKLNTAL